MSQRLTSAFFRRRYAPSYTSSTAASPLPYTRPPPPPLRVSFYPAPTATASCPLLLTQQQRLLLLCLCARAHVMIAELTRSSTFSRQGPCHVLRHLLTSEAVTRCLFSKFDSSGPSRIATAAAAIKCCVQ